MPHSIRTPGAIHGCTLATYGLVFAICCAADAFVLRTVWTGREITLGQFRRGYFERFGDEVGLAVDDDVRPGTIPRFMLTPGGELGVPPGMTAVLPLVSGTHYELTSESARAPYVVLGAQALVAPAASSLQLLPGEARLVGGRTLSMQDGRLALVAWDPTRPWREDAAQLTTLHDGCATPDARLALMVTATEGRLAIRLGRCSFTEPLPSFSEPVPLLAALAGPEWLSVARRPRWPTDRWVVWTVLAIVVAKVAAMWWSVNLAAATAVSLALGCAALAMPAPATLTWPLTLIIAVVAATVRAAVLGLRKVPRRMRVPVALAVVALAAGAVTIRAMQPDSVPSIVRTHADRGQADTCAVVGYSAVKGEGLRRERGGIRSFLDTGCMRCRDQTAGLFAGGETLAWARDAYCASAPTFGAGGLVTFLGGANDDFFWGMISIARLFIISQQGSEPWRRNVAAAAAASQARIEEQASAIDGLMRCTRSRGARFLFLHDFLVTDMVAGREPDRAAMLSRRRAAVEVAGGTFVDLFEVFATQAGVAWFNDYVHPSLVAHERIADLVCRQSP